MLKFNCTHTEENSNSGLLFFHIFTQILICVCVFVINFHYFIEKKHTLLQHILTSVYSNMILMPNYVLVIFSRCFVFTVNYFLHAFLNGPVGHIHPHMCCSKYWSMSEIESEVNFYPVFRRKSCTRARR